MKEKVIILPVIAACILAVAVLYIRFGYREQICVNGAVYTQEGENVSALPADSVELGALQGITHRTTESPSEDFHGTNLDVKYAGCPIYQHGELIYLEDFGGFYIPFRCTE